MKSVAQVDTAAVDSLPWEDRSEETKGRFIRTWIMLITQPGRFYRRMALRGGMGEPFSFQVLCVGLAFAVTVVWFGLAYGLLQPQDAEGWRRGLVAWFPGWQEPMAFIFNLACVFALLTPFFALGCTLDCLIFGALARLMGGAGERGATVESYFSVFAYATGPMLLAVVPGLGWLVAVPWWVFLSYKGLREAIGLRPTTALLALIVPILLYALLVWFAVAIF